MQKCTKCNRPIPEGAKFCGHCGHVTYGVPNAAPQPPFKQYEVTPYDKHGRPLTQEGKPMATTPNCDLSVAGFVLSLINPFLCVIALILSSVAIGKKQIRRGLAIAGLILSLLEIVAFGVLIYLVYVVHVDISQYVPWLQQQ